MTKEDSKWFNRVPPSDLILAAAALAALVLAATVAQADMSTIDTDGDGTVSYTELLISVPDLTETQFSSLDVDQSGALDEDEYTAATGAGLLPAE